MYWKDTRLTHNQTEVKKKEPLPITKSEHPGFPGSVNKSYVLLKVLGAIISQATITRFLKDPDDIKRLWKQGCRIVEGAWQPKFCAWQNA